MDAREVEVSAVVLGVGFRPQHPEYLQELVGDRPPFSITLSQDLELFLQPTHADAAYHSPAREHVQGGEHLGLHHRVAIGQDEDRAAQLDSLGASRQVAEKGHRLQKRVVRRPREGACRSVRVLVGAPGGQHDVVPGQHGLEPEVFGRPDELLQPRAVGQPGYGHSYFQGLEPSRLS